LDTSPKHWYHLQDEYAAIRQRLAQLAWDDEEGAIADAVNLLEHAHSSTEGTLPPNDAAAMLAVLEEYLLVRRAIAPETLVGWQLMWSPRKIDFSNLVDAEHIALDGSSVEHWRGHHHRRRDGFALTDTRAPLRDIMRHVDYCMICHERQKDSCSKGFRESDGTYKRNPLGVQLTGCPLDEHISEMHALTARGHSLAALAMVTINNPLCAGT
ncbi:MAG: pyridine nucleotide-disulfide oxidoreductase, partial [Chlorobi bacterium]|nr:pyridine nucleotide-disulfide oxidoreductase [Chlorobiota bacterium]